MMSDVGVFTWCKENKDQLVSARKAGDECARNIIAVHDMYVRFPEHAALAILEELVKDWKQYHGGNGSK